MNIAIVGPGAIGSTFAYHLARAGHDVTVVARGQRLAYLEKTRAIVTSEGERAPVLVSGALDTQTPWDLVLVSVLDHQVDAVLPTLSQSAARQVMFMFNTFAPFDRLRDAVGAERFVFGFPAIAAQLQEGKLKAQVIPRALSFLQITIVTDPRWAEIFSKAGIPTDTQPEMHSWLRTHAALVAPMMTTFLRAYQRGRGITWEEAREMAAAMTEGFDLVRSLGHRLTPPSLETFSKLPAATHALLFWAISRSAAPATFANQGPTEARALIDAMATAAPGQSARLQALRP